MTLSDRLTSARALLVPTFIRRSGRLRSARAHGVNRLLTETGVVLLVFTSACTSSSGTSASGPINLGLVAPLSGSRAVVGQGMVKGVEEALDMINPLGGVQGHVVRLVVQDDAGDPADAVPAAQKEIQSDNVVAIIGPTSLTASVVVPLASKAGIPDIMFGGGAAFDKETDPHFFRVSPSDTAISVAITAFAHSKGWTRVALAFGDTSSDLALVPGIMGAVQQLGMTVTGQVTIAGGSTSFRSEIHNLFVGNPQAILGQFDVTSAAVLFGELKQQGLTSTPWVTTDLWLDKASFAALGSSTATGPIYMVSDVGSPANPGYASFVSIMKQYTGTSTPLPGEAYMYDAVNLWALGAQEAGTLNSPGIEQGILKVANGPGTACFDYTSCSQLLKAGKAISYTGAGSSDKFDQYHNQAFGPYSVLHFNADESTTLVTTMTPTGTGFAG